MTTEYDRIWMEAHRASQADEYFKARPFFNDQTYRRVFDAAFQLGWEAHGDTSEGVVERAKKLGVVTVPVSEVLDELARLRAALSALSLSADLDRLTMQDTTLKSSPGDEWESEMTISAEYKAKTSSGASIHIANNHLPLQVNQMITWMLEHPEFALGMVPLWQAFADHAKE